MKRNLLFYIYPTQTSAWQWHLDALQRYWPVFNGRKIIMVAEDERTVKARQVADRLAKPDADVMSLQNNPRLGETKAFIAALARLESGNDDEATFYGHGKGATHEGKQELVVRSWCETMYRMNLSAPRLIDRILKTHDAAGCFRRPGRKESRWHYSGSFFWFKHKPIFSRDWRKIRRDRFGVEDYLGGQIAARRACALTPTRDAFTLYTRALDTRRCREWLDRLEARFPQWQS